MTEKKPLTEIEAVYLGRTTLSTGKLGDRWVTLDQWNTVRDEVAEPENRFHSLERISSAFPGDRTTAIVGGVYALNGEVDSDGGLVRLASARRFVRAVGPGSALATFHAITKGAEAEVDRKRAEEKLRKNPPALAEIAALRTAYHAAKGPSGRVAMEAAILNMIRWGVK